MSSVSSVRASLSDSYQKSTLSTLRKVEVTISSITLSASRQSPLGLHRGVIKDFRVTAGLAHLNSSPHLKFWNGRAVAPENYDSDTYTLTLAVQEMRLERGTRLDSLPLVTIGHQSLHLLAHQWPTPLLTVSTFLAGDPNSPFIGIAYRLDEIQATQRLDHLQELLASIDKLKRPHPLPKESPASSPTLARPLGLARFSFSSEIGPVCLKLIFSSTSGHTLQALELRTTGLVVKAQSEYYHANPTILKKYPTSSSVVPVRLQADFSVYLEPVSVMTRTVTEIFDSQRSTLEDPSVLSMGTFELTGHVHGIAETEGPGEGIAVIDRESLLCECSSVIEAICVELWNPHVVDSVHQLLSVIPVKDDIPPSPVIPPPSRNSRFSKLPIGLSARGYLGQFVFFVTAPDINPNDNLDLSRGVSIRFAAVLESRCLRPSHVHWLELSSRSTNRAKLKLLNDSLNAEKEQMTSQTGSATFVRLRLANLTLRNLVATPFEPSEPLIIEQLDTPQLPQDVFRIKRIQIDVAIASTPSSSDRVPLEDFVDVNVDIPSVRGDFKIAHIYSAMLAMQTVKSFRPPRSVPRPKAPVRSKFTFTLQLNIPTIQFFWTLPKRNIVTRVNGFKTFVSSNGPPNIGFEHATVFVPLPARVNRWESSLPGRWDEILSLQKWDVSVSPLQTSMSIAVKGESGRLKIPSGFVFHDLVFDTVIVIKALKHIAHITKGGRFWKMPAPEPEGPKSIPHINLKLDFLCLEAQDDPFESRLGLIWQAGADAVKQRQEREDAFAAKVAAIKLAEQQAGNVADLNSEYHFGSKHSVPIEEARQRLDQVHVLDWMMRLQKLSGTRLAEGEAILQDLFGTEPSHEGSSEPNIVPVVPPSSQDPPIVRFSLHGVDLTASPPSFPLAQLPAFLHKQGNGMPLDTEYSLLVPMHLHFSLSSMRCTLKDYPIPLVDILPHDDGKSIVWTFDTDLVIAEEIGTEHSALWYECAVIDKNDSQHGETEWSILVPKTIMPVKTYANASIKVTSPYPTIFGWGISHGPAMQDLMRIIETLTSPPQDPSPPMGFWDKVSNSRV